MRERTDREGVEVIEQAWRQRGLLRASRNPFLCPMRWPAVRTDVTRRVQGEFRGEGEGERPLRDLHAVDRYRPVGFGLP